MKTWTNADLDALRHQTDPLADGVVADLHDDHDVARANALLRTLVHDLEPAPADLPASVVAYLATTRGVDVPVDEARLLAGQRVFADYGPEISMVLSTYSLPASYCAAKGVEVLWRTGKLYTNPRRRVLETAQMVIDVLKPGGLGPRGDGLRAAQRVRLMHAGVRYLLLRDAENPWDSATLGAPINQEDMAGTLGTFGYIVLDGLERLGAPLSDEQKASYLYAWDIVAAHMGLLPELRPQSFAEAKALTNLIHTRQIAASDAGRAMMAALVDMLREQTPVHLFDGLGPTMIRHFIADEALCDAMGVPPADWTRTVLSVVDEVTHFVGGEEARSAGFRRAARSFGVALLQGLVTAERGGKRPSFAIPGDLAAGWGVYARSE